RNQQAEVWNRVAQAQEKLATNLKSSVKSNESASSLQLTLENKELLQAAGAYTKALSGIIEGDQDVIGYAFAINGKLNSADIYASSALFRKLWPKLLKAAAIEAIVDLVDEDFKPATADDIKSCFTDAEKGRKSEKDITGNIKMVTQETEKNILF